MFPAMQSATSPHIYPGTPGSPPVQSLALWFSARQRVAVLDGDQVLTPGISQVSNSSPVHGPSSMRVQASQGKAERQWQFFGIWTQVGQPRPPAVTFPRMFALKDQRSLEMRELMHGEGRVKPELHVFQMFLGLQISFSPQVGWPGRWMCLGAFPSSAAGWMLARSAGLAGEISTRMEKLTLAWFSWCRLWRASRWGAHRGPCTSTTHKPASSTSCVFPRSTSVKVQPHQQFPRSCRSPMMSRG